MAFLFDCKQDLHSPLYFRVPEPLSKAYPSSKTNFCPTRLVEQKLAFNTQSTMTVTVISGHTFPWYFHAREYFSRQAFQDQFSFRWTPLFLTLTVPTYITILCPPSFMPVSHFCAKIKDYTVRIGNEKSTTLKLVKT